jgi:hypothetical protein
MHADRQSRLQMRRPLLDQSHSAIAQSFLRSLITFPGIAKLHQPKLSDLFHYVIYLFGILKNRISISLTSIPGPSQIPDSWNWLFFFDGERLRSPELERTEAGEESNYRAWRSRSLSICKTYRAGKMRQIINPASGGALRDSGPRAMA